MQQATYQLIRQKEAMQGMKPQKPYQSPEISNEGNNSINNRKHARGGRRFKWSSSILAALPFKLRQNCWEADEKKEGRSLVWSEKHQFPWRLARKKNYIYNFSLFYETFPQTLSLTGGSKLQEAPHTIWYSTGEKKNKTIWKPAELSTMGHTYC